MKVQQQFASWDHETPTTPSTVFCCKRLRPLAPKPVAGDTTPTLDLRNFIKPEIHKSKAKNVGGRGEERREPVQLEGQSGGTRWNPTQEQIGILEMLYGGGMRTPNAQQIEHITVQLSKYGKIEGKNVFYWFQNHKARERQKQKRNSLSLGTLPNCRANKNLPLSPGSPSAAFAPKNDNWLVQGGAETEDDSYFKRKCRSWAVQGLEVESKVCGSACEDKTLELFPLHPESR